MEYWSMEYGVWSIGVMGIFNTPALQSLKGESL
jgi:hypothetical protein